MQSPPRSHRRASSTPRLRCHAPTLRCWKWRVVSDALTLVVTSTIIDGVTPLVNGCRGDLLCVSGRSTRPSGDISRSLIVPRRCSACRRWTAVLNRRRGVGNPVQQQLYRATTSDDTRHSSGMAEYTTLVPTTCSVGSTGAVSLSAALLADGAVTKVCTPAPSDNVFVHDKPSASRRTLYGQNVTELQPRISIIPSAKPAFASSTMARRCPRIALTSPRRRRTLSPDDRPLAYRRQLGCARRSTVVSTSPAAAAVVNFAR